MTYTILGRDHWNAVPPSRQISERKWANVTGITIHHSGASKFQSIREIQQYHMEEHGWFDIGYNHLIKGGAIYRGRGWLKTPVHDKVNTNIGVCILGNYENELPDARDLDALCWYIQTARAFAGRKLAVTGHGDIPTNTTACPGRTFRQWVRDKRYEKNGGARMDFWAEQHEIKAYRDRYLDPESPHFDPELRDGVHGSTAVISGYLHSRTAAEELLERLPILERKLDEVLDAFRRLPPPATDPSMPPVAAPDDQGEAGAPEDAQK